MRTLFHVALFPEAKPIIRYLNLKKNLSLHSYRVYENDEFVLIVSGMGEVKTYKALEFIYSYTPISRAINVGLAGSKDHTIVLGTLCCCSHTLDRVPRVSITTSTRVITNPTDISTVLVDMESAFFLTYSQHYLIKREIYIFKVVSDYLSQEIPSKNFIYESITKAIKQIYSILSYEKS